MLNFGENGTGMGNACFEYVNSNSFYSSQKKGLPLMKRNKISTHVLFLFKLFFIPTDEYDAVYYFYGCKITPNIVPM